MSRIPEGLALALRGIAERLQNSPEDARQRGKAHVVAANLTALDGERFAAVYAERWLTETAERAAHEIRALIDAWSKPLPRTRKRR